MDRRNDIDEVEAWIKKDPLAKTLLKKSLLNMDSLKAILLYYWSEDITFRELASKLNLKKPGAWKRWKKGLDLIMGSFYTLELAIYAGILEAEAAELLAEDLQDYVRLARGEGDIDDIRDRLEKRMANLSNRGI